MRLVINKPVISEKSMKLANNGVYTFLVHKDSRKPEIKKAIMSEFGVDVTQIKTVNLREQTKLQRTRKGYFTLPGMKKALVSLKKGQRIALFETLSGGTQEEVVVTTAEGEPITEVKERKSLLKKTKVKVEKVKKEKK